MLSVETRHAIHQDHAKTMGTDELRRHFHVGGLFREGEIRLVYTHYDRFVMGGAVPGAGTLTLDKVEETRTATFLERREMAIVNIGETGQVSTDGNSWTLERGDVLYIGRGAGAVTLGGPGRFYLLSAPAHATHPTRLIKPADARRVELGSKETANERVITVPIT